jgi:UDP-glucose 4-epimerase
MGPRRAGDPPALVAAVDRARSELGWSARRATLAEMIGSAWEWRRRHLDPATGGRLPPTPA